ncbi:MAG: DUF2262 domain-containing protein [Oscillospiraceae bacterium]|nr:DUF2262 domain-containing protein [Oscillospiraceae bacterium]
MNHLEEIRNFPERIKIEAITPDDVFSYTGKASVWGKETDINICFDDPSADENQKTLPEEILVFLEKYLAWINQHRQDVLQTLFDDDILELAEDWASSAEPYYDEDDEEADEPEYYIMEDGQKVFFPITEQDFSNSLQLTAITFNCPYEDEEALTEIWCDCSPDYFAYHSILIYLNADGSFENGSLQG